LRRVHAEHNVYVCPQGWLWAFAAHRFENLRERVRAGRRCAPLLISFLPRLFARSRSKAGDFLAVNDCGAAIKLGCCLRYAGVLLSPIEAVAGVGACFAAFNDE
jgi:hypothetical protein